MRGMSDECVDLIYLDPPFNSNTSYAAPVGSEAAGAEFRDTWGLSDIDLAWHGEIAEHYPGLYELLAATRTIHSDSMMSYLIYMAIRIMEMKRILKTKASVYLHCDPTAGHYLKLMMDAVFGRKNFQSHITWQRTFAHNDKMFAALSDHLLWYAKDGTPIRNAEAVRVEFSHDELVKKFPHRDDSGRYTRSDLMGPGTSSGESGTEWRGCNPTKYGRCWSAPKTGKYAQYLHDCLLPGYLDIQSVHDRLNALDAAGLIIWASSGVPWLKRYAMPEQGRIPGDLWTDVPPLSRTTKERTGYPTQKPLKLLRRIIRASSNEGDLVLDPFCGCATTCVAAEIEYRHWIGIDVSPKAYDLVNSRLKREVHVGESGMFGEVIHRLDIPLDRKGRKSKNIKHIRYGEQEGRCNGCFEHFPFKNMTEDHKIPRARGGADTDDNIQLLCNWCNSKKGHRMTHDELVTILIQDKIRK